MARVAPLLFAVAVCFAQTGCNSQSPAATSPSSSPATNSIATKTPAKASGTEVDLRAIATAIVKEPKYTSTPRYALLAFGERAEKQMWLVVDGKTVYLDRNCDGDLTAADETIPLDEIATAKVNLGGSGEYIGMDVFNLGTIGPDSFVIQVWVLAENFTPQPGEREMLTEYRKQRIANNWMNASMFRTSIAGNGGAQIPVLLCPKPEHAQISHINGPLTFSMKGEQDLKRSNSLFSIHIGTPGIAATNCKYPVYSKLSTREVPTGVVPTAVFTFEDESGEPIPLTVDLDLRC